MKRIKDIERRLWSRIGGWLPTLMLIGGLLFSCSKEEGDATSLPDGKYPLQLTTEVVQPQTRAGGKDMWMGGEEIGVMLGDMLSPKRYVMDASGKAEPADAENTIYWKNTAETRITAWTPNIFDPNVDISDQSGGYADFDLLYATAMGRYDQAVNLRFNHRMAKVEFTLAASDGITDEVIDGATVTLFGDPEAYFSGGMVGVADRLDGEIKPYYDVASKKYEAVVVPQNMTGKPLVRISIGGKIFVYAPETDVAGKLEANKRYTYTVTVKADGIDVQPVSGGTWNDGGVSNVTSKEVKFFKADELKIGDYFYSDGTWSDGGLRKLFPNGSMEIANPKPAPVLKSNNGASRKVIGIVFQTDPNRIGAAEKTKLGNGNVHGLVLAVKNASTDALSWGPDGDEGLTKCNSKRDNYNDISGYGNYEHIRANRRNFNKYPAFKAVDGWNASKSEHKAPRNTTGWYLPSSGQWWDIMQNLGGCLALAQSEEQNSSSTNSDYISWSNQGNGNVSAALNRWMTHIADDSKNIFYVGWFWTSSEGSLKDAQYWSVSSSSWVDCFKMFKCNDGHVRPVLAF